MNSEIKNNSDFRETLRKIYKRFNKCYIDAYTGSNYEERDEYRQLIKATKELPLKPETDKPETYALIAYMLLKASRLRAIINNVAKNPDLKNQNRTLWDKRMIEDGLHYLEKSAGGKEVSEYHLRAAVCACHSLAKNYESTDWEKILSLYDQYLEINITIEIVLERANVISIVKGPKAAVDSILRITSQKNIQKDIELNLILAGYYMDFHNYKEAISYLSKSHALSNCDKEKSIFQSKIELCKQQLELTKKYDQVLSF